MAALTELQFEEVSNLLQKHFLSPLEARIQHAENILKAVALRLEKWDPSSKTAATDRFRLRTELISIAESQLPEKDQQEFNHYFPDLEAQLDAFIMEQEEVRLERQVEERFVPQADDPAWLRSAKFWKRRARRLGHMGQGVGNWFRKASGGEESALQPWLHEVPWQLLLRQHLQVQLLHRLQELIDIAEQQRLALLQAAYDLSTLPDRQPAPARIEVQQEIELRLQRARNAREQTSELLNRQLDAVLGRLYIELEQEYTKAGTLELPARKLRLPLLQERTGKRRQQIEDQLAAWQNTQLALCNHWRLHLQLHNTAGEISDKFDLARLQWQQGLQTQVFTGFDKVAASLKNIKATLAQAPLPGAFTECRHKLRQQVSRQEVAATADALTQLSLPEQLQQLEGPLQEILSALPEQTVLAPYGAGNELTPVPAAALVTILPREVVSLEVLPMAVRRLLQLRNDLLQQVEEIRLRLGEMEEMSLFNLDTAHAYWEQHPQDEQKARAFAFEGIDRTRTHAASLQERLRNLSSTTWQEVEQLQHRISQSLFQLNNLENVRSLQMRMFKARTRQRTETLQEKATKQAQTLLPRLQQYLRSSLSFAGRQQQRIRSRLGIEVRSASIATELSDFLAENEQSLQRLPFVYQRLYTVEPLTDELFLIGRTAELQTLQDGYRRWKEGKFSPLLISGEKGSGCTSLLNVFLKRLPQQQQVARLSLTSPVADQKELAQQLARATGLPENSAMDQVLEYLQKPQSPLVIVVEDLQHLFRRWVGGFELMKAFLELVSLTGRTVFWLCSCTLYSWQYLDRVMQGSETWERVVFLQEFTPAQLSELILRRHRVSGYQLQFEPGPNDLQNKKFVAMSAEEQQTYLEVKYFQKLSLFAQSNLQLALLYWLRSTLAVSKSTVNISTSLNPEFGFLLHMTQARYFILHALLLHEHLSARELSHIFGETENSQRRQLQMLHDDGLLLRNEDRFSLNPLLYRQIVNVLKQKNLVH
ncbi:AAA family ATPase [Cesiribacter sp. SM1]|uniref:AAA family ATPase n=1 Tax=Cesiribacter sp. SM1 TaxID=2861196 RepID=UPI001CD726EC|nr:AAA family ATPase [Cesiribacter sp. SM1]